MVSPDGGRMVAVHPRTQIVAWIVAWVTAGSTEPGVQARSGRRPESLAWHWPGRSVTLWVTRPSSAIGVSTPGITGPGSGLTDGLRVGSGGWLVVGLTGAGGMRLVGSCTGDGSGAPPVLAQPRTRIRHAHAVVSSISVNTTRARLVILASRGLLAGQRRPKVSHADDFAVGVYCDAEAWQAPALLVRPSVLLSGLPRRVD